MTRDRFLAPDYADGVSAPRVSSSGFPLPSPRAVSTSVHQDDGFHDHAVTVLMVAWGQFMDHDLTLTAETRSVDIYAAWISTQNISTCYDGVATLQRREDW